MSEFFTKLFSSDFEPHGYCYLWNPRIVWLHAVSDGSIAFAYYLIPLMLIYFVRRRRDLPFHWMFLMFGLFIFGCGTTHLMEVWTVWHGTYRLAGVIKAFTAFASLATAGLLVTLIPQALALPSPEQLRTANANLEREIRERFLVEEALQRAHGELESKVQQRTAELARANDQLRGEIGERRRAEDALQKAQTLFENFFEFSPDAIVVTDGNGGITRLNSEAERVFGYKRAELLGLPVETLMPERFRAAHPGHRGLYSARPSVRPMGTGLELFGRRKDSTEFPVEIMLSPVGTADGPIFLSVIRDVSEKKRAEEALRQSEQQLRDKDEQTRRDLRQIIDAIPQQVSVCDADWSPLFANQRELEYTGLTPQEAQSKDAVAKIFHPEDFKKLEVLRERMISEGAPSEMEARIRGKDGQYRWFLIRDNPLRDEQGGVLRWYGTRTDIEDRKRAEETLRQAQANLAHVSRVMTLGELTASLSHEVNQPLAAVVTNGQVCLRLLALETPRLDEMRAAVERIVRDANRASEVIQRIRALAKRSAPQMISLDINDVVREAILLVQREVLSHGVSLRTELSPALPLVLGDRVQLQQVVINLLMNGVEAMASITDRPREILIRSQLHEAGQVLVAVLDSGIGIDSETAEQLFSAFFTTKPSGMGMGLSISRSIIRAHGGRLWVSPNADHGAAFQFTVPING
jgi:PAS domain S-box-containing protein